MCCVCIQAIATLDNLYASLKKVELAVAAQQPEFISPRYATFNEQLSIHVCRVGGQGVGSFFRLLPLQVCPHFFRVRPRLPVACIQGDKNVCVCARARVCVHRVAEALRYTAELELLQAPGLPFSLPKVSSSTVQYSTVHMQYSCSTDQVQYYRPQVLGTWAHDDHVIHMQAHTNAVQYTGSVQGEHAVCTKCVCMCVCVCVCTQDYRNLPRLVGRSVVQLQIQRADGSLAFLDPVKGGLSSTGTIEVR